MTPLEAGVAIGVVLVPAVTSAVSMALVRRSAVVEAKKIRDEAAEAAKTLKTEAAAATLTAREAAVAAKEAVLVVGETSEKLDGVAKQLDGRLSQFFKMHAEAMEALEKRLVEARDDAFVRGTAAGRALTVETEITKGQSKIEEVLENQNKGAEARDKVNEARHIETMNGALNGTLNGSKERKP